MDEVVKTAKNDFYILSSAAPKSWCEWIGDTSDSLGKYADAEILNTDELDRYEKRPCSLNHFYFEQWPPPVKLKIAISSDWRLPDLLHCYYYVSYLFSERLVRTLERNKVKGIDFQEVEVVRIKKPRRNIKPKYYAPILKNFFVKVKEERGVKYEQCKECGVERLIGPFFPGTKKEMFSYNGLIIDEKTWDGSDFFSTAQRHDPSKFMVVTQKVFDILIRTEHEKFFPTFTNVSLCPTEIYDVEEYKKELLEGPVR